MGKKKRSICLLTLLLCFLSSSYVFAQSVDDSAKQSADTPSASKLTVSPGPAAMTPTTSHSVENVAVENLGVGSHLDVYVDYKKEDQSYTCLRLLRNVKVLSMEWSSKRDKVSISWLLTQGDSKKLMLAKTVGRLQLCPHSQGPDLDCFCKEKKAKEAGDTGSGNSNERSRILIDGKEYDLGSDGRLKQRKPEADK